MIRRPPRSTRTDTLFPYTTLCRAREAVEDEAVGAVGLIDAVGNHGDHEVVRHAVAGIHDRLRLAAELAARGSGSAQHIASRELDQIVPLFQALGLSFLARARRSPQNDIHPSRPLRFDFLITPSYWFASR